MVKVNLSFFNNKRSVLCLQFSCGFNTRSLRRSPQPVCAMGGCTCWFEHSNDFTLWQLARDASSFPAAWHAIWGKLFH